MTVHDAISGVKGFSVAGVCAGLKGTAALDFALMVSDRPCAAAGVFTTNRVCAAPVCISQAALKAAKGRARAIVINAGMAPTPRVAAI